MSLQSLARVGAQCIAHRPQLISVARSRRGDLGQVARPFYSASSLQLPRRRQTASKNAGQDLHVFESDAQIEDALSGYSPPTKESRRTNPKFLVDEEESQPRSGESASMPRVQQEKIQSQSQRSAPTQTARSEDTLEEAASINADIEPSILAEDDSLWKTAVLSTEPVSEDGTPWYLQAQASEQPLPEVNPLLERQKIPDVPSDAPPVLQPLLDHISVTLGLDSLSLIDLRHLDPPAALGANLLMVVGTARSEKHLHVSADRLCRWLRSEYKLRPYADGLLGRNELKLKMKRKNRRTKTLAAAGLQGWNGPNGLEKEADDGIRTGWVCVHMGRVEPAPGSPEIEQKKDRTIEVAEPAFIGFGETESHVTIVVQMFTEQKRDETDLEGLWSEISQRGVRKLQHRRNMDIEAERILDEGLPGPSDAQYYDPASIPPTTSGARMQARAN